MASPVDQWLVVNGELLLQLLKRAHDGEDPALLYVELIANSESESE